MSLDFLKKSLTNQNVKAFLMMIRHSEGTNANDGYQYLFGSNPNNQRRFTDFSKHPNIDEPFGAHNFSTAAGAYQILDKFWVPIQKMYNLPDFSPASQDIAAVEQISERNALQLVMDGKFDQALRLVSNIWASLPYNAYGQPQHPVVQYSTWYVQAGGKIC